MELERRRATDLVHAKINREAAQQKADAAFYTDNKTADALLYKQQQDASAKFLSITKGADATLYSRQKDAEAGYLRSVREADAAFYAAKKEAEGVAEKAKAYEQLSKVLGGPQFLLQYMMLQDNTYEKLALANAKAVNGLQPKITVWNTGASAGSGEGEDQVVGPIRNILQSLPPLLTTINEQTGIAPPGWLAKMGEGSGSQALELKAKGKGLTNGDVPSHQGGK